APPASSPRSAWTCRNRRGRSGCRLTGLSPPVAAPDLRGRGTDTMGARGARSAHTRAAKRSSARDNSDRMSQPHVRLDVRARAVREADGSETVRDDVVAVLGELQAGPLLPLLARARDRHRTRRGREDLRAEALVRPDPRVVVVAVLPAPQCVALDRRQRVALLPRRPDGSDHRVEAVRRAEAGHAP